MYLYQLPSAILVGDLLKLFLQTFQLFYLNQEVSVFAVILIQADSIQVLKDCKQQQLSSFAKMASKQTSFTLKNFLCELDYEELPCRGEKGSKTAVDVSICYAHVAVHTRTREHLGGDSHAAAINNAKTSC